MLCFKENPQEINTGLTMEEVYSNDLLKVDLWVE